MPLLAREGLSRLASVMQTEVSMKDYQTPEVTDLGSLEDLTLLADTKDTTGSDGEIFLGIPLGPVS
jgi:hypothetical protein